MPEDVVRRGAADRVMRLALRLALTALRSAAPSVASDCCASTCRLLSGMLRAQPVPRAGRQHAGDGDAGSSAADRCASMRLSQVCIHLLRSCAPVDHQSPFFLDWQRLHARSCFERF